MRGGLAVVLTVVFGLAGPATAQVKEILEFQGPSRAGGMVTVKADLFLPEGSTGRVPAMVIVHGSGGVSDAREYAYAREFIKMGVAAIIPDSFTPRGVKNTVVDQAPVPAIDMVADAFALLKVAVRHPRLDPARIGITGFSKGGSVALRTPILAVADRFAPAGPRFALHVPFYPGCDTHYANVKTTGAPILVLIGGADTYAGTQPCLDFAAKMRAQGANLDTVVYPNAQHSWDSTGRPYSIANGENNSRCVYVEQADRSWVEQTSGITTAGPGGRAIEGAAQKAAAVCRSRGVTGGPDPDARAKSLEALKGAVRTAFELN